MPEGASFLPSRLARTQGVKFLLEADLAGWDRDAVGSGQFTRPPWSQWIALLAFKIEKNLEKSPFEIGGKNVRLHLGGFDFAIILHMSPCFPITGDVIYVQTIAAWVYKE